MEPRQHRTASDDNLIARLKRAEEALGARQLEFQLIVDSIPAQVAVITPTGEVDTLNQPCLEYFGKTLGELKGWASSDPVHPEDLPHVIEVLTHALETGETYEVEARHRRYDGVYRWFHVRGFPLKDADGSILRWWVLITDINDRKRAEAQLAGEKRLLEMVASGSALTAVLTELCRFVENTTADCKCGIYLIDWRGPTFHLGAAPSLPATFNDPVEGLTVTSDAGPCGAAALTKSQVIVTDIESDPRFQSATIRPLLLAHGLRSHWSTPICSRDGRVLGTFAIFQETSSNPTQLQQDLITQVTHIASIAIERTLSEEALKRSEGELKLTIDTMPALAWSANADGKAEFFNQHYLDYVGLSADEMDDWGWISAVHPDDREDLAHTWQRIMASEQSGEGEARLRRHDGEYRWFLFRTNPMCDESGRLVKWYGININIDDRKRAQAK